MPQTHEPGQLVESLPGRVVEGLAQHPVVPPVAGGHHLAVPARSQQNHGRGPEVGKLQAGGEQVALHMIHPQKRQPPRPSQGFGERKTHQQRTGQARTAGGGDAVQVVGMNCRLIQGAVGEGADRLHMGAGRHLRHHSPEPAVQLHLRPQHVAAHLRPLHHRRRCFIAGSFKSQHQRSAHGNPSRILSKRPA